MNRKGRKYDKLKYTERGGIFVNLIATGARYISLFTMILNLLMRLVAIYTMYIATKALKVYIKKNS